MNYTPLPTYPFSRLRRGDQDGRHKILLSASQSAFLRRAKTQHVPYNSSYTRYRAKEGERKKFSGSKFYCTVTLAAYPSNLCIREHLSKQHAVVSPVAISASSLGSIFNLWMKGWIIGERRSLISIAAGVSRIRYTRV